VWRHIWRRGSGHAPHTEGDTQRDQGRLGQILFFLTAYYSVADADPAQSRNLGAVEAQNGAMESRGRS
jgi:hypothetical protein